MKVAFHVGKAFGSRQSYTVDSLGIIFHIPALKHKIQCDPSSELSHGNSSNEGSQHMILLRNKKNISEILS